MSIWPLHTMRHFNFEAVDWNSARSQFEFTLRYSGVKVAPGSPACSADRHRVLTWGADGAPFMITVSVNCHRPGEMPSAAAGKPAKAPRKAMAQAVTQTPNRDFIIVIGQTYRARP